MSALNSCPLILSTIFDLLLGSPFQKGAKIIILDFNIATEIESI